MQTVWSRVAQTRGSCCCPQCLQSVQGVSRRATASATRRIPKFATSSTLFYSGIFAAAATWDAGAKKRRREQWDKAIAEVRHELGQAAETLGQQSEVVPSVPVLEAREAGAETTLYSPDIFEDVEPRIKPRWPTNTGPELEVINLPPESLYANEFSKAKAAARRWTSKKIETAMLSVDILQLQIFAEVQRESNLKWRQAASAAVPVDYRDRMFQAAEDSGALLHGKKEDLKLLMKEDHHLLAGWSRSPEDVPLSSYRQDDQGVFHGAVRQLNTCLQDLFRLQKTGAISTPALLAKVAYNLSASPAPPNVHTFNTLLLGLEDLNEAAIARHVIHCMRTIHIRPNEVTNIAVLEHYTSTNHTDGFVRWVEIMRGKHGGLALAKPGIQITEASRGRLVPREGTDNVIQLPYPTPNVFAALIKGMLKFSGFESALSVCEGMGREGWGLCMSGLTPLLIDCANRGDWQSGLAVWRQIQALKLRSRRQYASHQLGEEKLPLDAFGAMVRLCSKVGEKEVFHDVWAQAVRQDARAARTIVEVVKAQNEAANKNASARSTGRASDIGEPGRLDLDPASALEAARDDMIADTEPLNPPLSLVTSTYQPSDPSDPSRILHDLEASKKHALDISSPDHRAASTLTREQLNGWLPGSHELEDYELRERPMTMCA